MRVGKGTREFLENEGVRSVSELVRDPRMDAALLVSVPSARVKPSQLARTDQPLPKVEVLENLVDAGFAERRAGNLGLLIFDMPDCQHLATDVKNEERFCGDCGQVFGAEESVRVEPSTKAETRNKNPDGTVDFGEDEERRADL